MLNALMVSGRAHSHSYDYVLYTSEPDYLVFFLFTPVDDAAAAIYAPFSCSTQTHTQFINHISGSKNYNLWRINCADNRSAWSRQRIRIWMSLTFNERCPLYWAKQNDVSIVFHSSFHKGNQTHSVRLHANCLVEWQEISCAWLSWCGYFAVGSQQWNMIWFVDVFGSRLSFTHTCMLFSRGECGKH